MVERRIPFVDMQARLHPLRDEILAAVARVVDSGIFVMGPEARALEEEFAAFSGVAHAVAVSNGTAALQLALLALEIGPGDEVITVSHTFIATVEAITATGAHPVLVDIEPDTYLLDPAKLEAVITPRTKAIIPVHLYGLVCDMDAILAVAKRHNLVVIEDACQAHGATYRGAPAGSFGDLACFSFYPAKNVAAIGEGGIIVTPHAELADRVRLLRSHGEVRRYEHIVPGWNFRLSEVLAASIRVQLRHAPVWNAGRHQVAAWYDDALAGLPVTRPSVPLGREHVYHLYVIQAEGRDALRDALREGGIDALIHYPVPVHLQPAYQSLGMTPGSLPVTEQITPRILSLPMFPEMTPSQVEEVATAVSQMTARPRVSV